MLLGGISHYALRYLATFSSDSNIDAACASLDHSTSLSLHTQHQAFNIAFRDRAMLDSALDDGGDDPGSEQELIATFFEVKVPELLSVDSRLILLTQDDCHEFASTLLHCQDIKPVKMQGSFSYTVFSLQCQKIVQFRLKRLDEATISLAYHSYGDLVPLATLVEGFALPVYIFPLARGHLHAFEPYPETPSTLEKRIKTVRDLAQFMARGALMPQPIGPYSPGSWTATAKSTLLMVVENQRLAEIEPKLSQRAKAVLARIELLMRLPAATCHTDFFENNVMVDPATGAVTAVLDWDGAQFEAFGMMIYGIYDNFFGSMTGHSSGAEWSSFGTLLPDSNGSMRKARYILESNFWDAFWGAVPSSFTKAEYEAAIAVAVEVGLVQRYLSQHLVEHPTEAPRELLKDISLMRGVWLSR